jgi:murein L,D-transpeptidase YcbB/YkuD
MCTSSLYRKFLLFTLCLCLLLATATFFGCHSDKGVAAKAITSPVADLPLKKGDDFAAALATLLTDTKKIRDSIPLKNDSLVGLIYNQNDRALLWSANRVLHAETDSLLLWIKQGLKHGLFPTDYHQQKLTYLKEAIMEGGGKSTEESWAQFDLLATSAFVQLVRDVKFGRLVADSVVRKDSSFSPQYILQQKALFATQPIDSFVHSLEPSIPDYHRLKAALRKFLPKANFKRYTLVRTTDSLLLPKLVYRRISEEDSLKITAVKNPDSAAVSLAVAKFQKWRKLNVDGKISPALVKRLNETDREKFIRIAISLDKYKMLPPMPATYLWVNLPVYFMELREGDSVRLKSKVICGKPATKTPQLTGVITDMITYPQWTIPESIIKKEILPGLKRSAGYTRSKGYSVVDYNGNEVDPYTVRWAKYKHAIPYKVVQGSGDANALGVIKFNFANPYAVYLHDTNQRYLFGRSPRALSHGCVRVQQWKELAVYLLRKDYELDSVKAVPADSLNSWLGAKKKKLIRLQLPLPLFIQYITCEGKNGKLIIHEDVYEEDKRLRDKLFANRN